MANPVTKRLSQVASVVTPPGVSMVAALAKNDPTAFLGPVGSAVVKNPKGALQAATSVLNTLPGGAVATFIAQQSPVRKFVRGLALKACNP